MRILATQETDWIGRNPIVHHRLLEDMSRRGHEVTVIDYPIDWQAQGFWPLWISGFTTTEQRKVFPDANVKLIRPSMLRLPGLDRLSWLLANVGILQKCLKQRPDVVIGYGLSNALLACRLAHRRRIPFVFHLLEVLHAHANPGPIRSIARRIEQQVLRSADRVFVVNNALVDYAVDMGAPRTRVEVVPIGTEVRTLDPVVREQKRAELDIAPSDLVAVYLGFMYRTSGLLEFVQEFVARSGDLKGAKLLIVGDGPLFAEIDTIRRNHGLTDSILMTGRRPAQEVPGFLAAADIGLWAALWDGNMQFLVPTKVLEYLEFGMPVLATRMPGLLAEFGEMPGLLFVKEPTEAVGRIFDLLKSGCPHEKLELLRASGLQAIAQRLNWEQVNEVFEGHLKSMADHLPKQ